MAFETVGAEIIVFISEKHLYKCTNHNVAVVVVVFQVHNISRQGWTVIAAAYIAKETVCRHCRYVDI